MVNDYEQPATTNNCWNEIGVGGNLSCRELETVIHCHNCPVYATAGRNLLEREAPAGYLQEWTNILAQEKEDKVSKERISLVIFRLAKEWLALPTECFKEIKTPRVIHTLPHRSNKIFLGLVNMRGQIMMCVSLKALLGIEEKTASSEKINPVVYERMVVIAKEKDLWVFSVDEIYGICGFSFHELQDAPVVITKATESYTKAIINWQNKKVSCLDEELLFYTLNRKIL
ncbi:MAG: chemotaxis protein CheW [Coleofasciculaceae cyanobacterium]